MGKVHVDNEIGRLKRVLVHRPGNETQRFPQGNFTLAFPLRPSFSGFDLAQAQAEHDSLTRIIADHGAEIVTLQGLLLETLSQAPAVRTELSRCFLADCPIEGTELRGAAEQYLAEAADADQLVTRLFEGIRYGDTRLEDGGRFPLAALTKSAFDPDTFLASPLNTSFFTRDPMSVIGEGICLNRMYWKDRNREAALLGIIARHHPDFAGVPHWYNHEASFHLEGGDIVNLARQTIAVGLSSRSEAMAIDELARNLLWSAEGSPITDIYVFEVPRVGDRLHLDAYLSRIDYDTFAIDPALRHKPAYLIRRGSAIGNLSIETCEGSLEKTVSQAVGNGPVRLLDFGEKDAGRAAFEYSNGSTGILALSPGNLCVCEENAVANELLSKAGMALHPVSVREMTAGFGGPNSLCLPLLRESL